LLTIIQISRVARNDSIVKLLLKHNTSKNQSLQRSDIAAVMRQARIQELICTVLQSSCRIYLHFMRLFTSALFTIFI